MPPVSPHSRISPFASRQKRYRQECIITRPHRHFNPAECPIAIGDFFGRLLGVESGRQLLDLLLLVEINNFFSRSKVPFHHILQYRYDDPNDGPQSLTIDIGLTGGLIDTHPNSSNSLGFYEKFLGQVQGVGFRYFVWREASELGVDGWVRNCADGTVEALVRGPRDKHDRLRRRLEEGPRWSRVTLVGVTDEADEEVSDGFEIRRDKA